MIKIVNAYIFYDLDTWLKIPLNNFKLTNCLFGVASIVKVWIKYVHSGYGIAFDGVGSWSFGNGFARNDVIFGVDNISSPHADKRKNNFLVLGKGPTDVINGSVCAAEQKFSVNHTKAQTKFCLRLHFNGGVNGYLFVKQIEIYNFKANNESVNFLTRFCLGSISNGFDPVESREVSLKRNVYDFSVDHNVID